jgi:hypothetical protein
MTKPPSSSPAKKKRGPAPTGKGKLIGVRLQPDELERLTKWRAMQADLPSAPEALRRLAGLALDRQFKGGGR